MFRRREPVPFAFIAEADRFRSNVTPPPRERAPPAQIAGRWLVGLTIVAGLVGLPAPRDARAVRTGAGTQQSRRPTGADLAPRPCVAAPHGPPRWWPGTGSIASPGTAQSSVHVSEDQSCPCPS